MAAPQAPRRQLLEAYFEKYPEAPREVVVKESILRDGLAFTEAALKAGEGRHTKTYHLFTFDKVSPSDMKQGEPLRVPECIRIYGGHYELRGRTNIRVRINPDSPYVVDVQGGKLRLCDSQGLVAEVADYPPRPKYYAKSFEDGTPYSQVVQLSYPGLGYPRVIAFMPCQYWGPKEECKYCDINENIRLRKERGALSISESYQRVDRVATVTREIILGEDWEEGARPKALMISGGSIFRKFMGKTEEQFYLPYVEAARYCCEKEWPLTADLQTTPPDKALARRMYDAGVRVHRGNFEVWDKSLFETICPGKARSVGRETWMHNLVESVDTFGVGNVYPGFVAGVEMAQPWGFKTVDEAIASNREGFEFLMSHGVIPRVINWLPEPHSALGAQEPPSLDYAIRIDLLWYEIWKKHSLPHPPGYERPMGPGRAMNPNGAFLDVGD
ncbi:MAG: radical SAM protein [Chloroflexota bacterium]|nr:radical SAM protein [Chloroflexota bacterium]